MRALKRFFISSSLARSNTILLPREETHHLKHVLRMKEGDLCLLFDSEGHEFVSRIDRYLADDCSEVSLLDSVSDKNLSAQMKLTIAQAIPQDRKMDDIIRQAAELGIYQIIPLVTERTIVRIAQDKFAKVMERWQRIAEQTLKQSRLSQPPRILQPVSFEALCQNLKSYQNVFILDPSEDAVPVRDAIWEKRNDLLLIIGPEGGFTPNEIQKAERSGAKRIKLGEGILKTDTAFVTAASFFKLMNL